MERVVHAVYRIRERNGTLYPTRRAVVDFLAPIRAGDSLTVEVVPRAGDTSVAFDTDGTCDDTRFFDAMARVVFVDSETVAPTSVPDERSRLDS